MSAHGGVSMEALEPRIMLSVGLAGAAATEAIRFVSVAAVSAAVGQVQHNAVASLDNNLQVVDLSDLDGELPLDIDRTTQVLWQTEDWEHPTWQNPNWPNGGGDTVGYPALVKNDKGPNPDGKFYLFYAHHDPRSSIGVAVADSITGPYSKNVNVPGRSDNIVVPAFHVNSTNVGDPDHTSSPWVVWNEDEQLWFVYFHYFNHLRQFEPGFQLTGMATTPDLASHDWTIWTDPGSQAAPPYVPVLPATAETWASEATSYSTFHRLVDGQWLAFIRGTSTIGGDPPKLGFATSTDGRNWNYFNENPILHQNDGGGGRAGVYRPSFVGYLGTNGSGVDEYLVAWQESHHFDGDTRMIFGYTTDFKNITRDPRGHVDWEGSDGAVSAWREGDTLYLFSGKVVHEIDLTVIEPPPSADLPYSETFNDGSADGFSQISGTWVINGANRFKGTAAVGDDAVAMVELTLPLPGPLQVTATVRGKDPVPEFFKNASLIFDYQGPGQFKFAGGFYGNSTWRFGQVSGGTWQTLVTFSDTIDVETDYALELVLDGDTATLTVDGEVIGSHTYGGSLLDGTIGVGTIGGVAVFDDVTAQTVAGLPYVEDFDDGEAPQLQAVAGNWWINGGGRLRVTPNAGGRAISLLNLTAGLPDHLSVSATLRGKDPGGLFKNVVIIFDYQGPNNFKFAGPYLGSGNWRIGRYNGSWLTLARTDDPLSVETDYDVELLISGNTATLLSGGQTKVAYTFGGSLTDGQLGLGTNNASAAIDDFEVRAAQPPLTLPYLENFNDQSADAFDAVAGTWWVNAADRYRVTSEVGEAAVSVVQGLALPENVKIDTILRGKDGGADHYQNALIVFDFIDADHFKFVGGYFGSSNWRIGRVVGGSWATLATAGDVLAIETDYNVAVLLTGSSVELQVNGQTKMQHTFGSSVTDGLVGLGTNNAFAAFDLFSVAEHEVVTGPSIPATPIVMWGYSDDQVADPNRGPLWDHVLQTSNLIEGGTGDAAFVNQLRAEGKIFAVHTHNTLTGSEAVQDVVDAWTAPFNDTLGGQLPSGFDAITIDELHPWPDGDPRSNLIIAVLAAIKAQYPDKLVIPAVRWQLAFSGSTLYGHSGANYDAQLAAIRDYTDLAFLEAYQNENNVQLNLFHDMAANLNARAPGFLDKTVFGLTIYQGWAFPYGDSNANVEFKDLLDAQFHTIRNDALTQNMAGIGFWAFYRSRPSTLVHAMNLSTHYFVQNQTSWHGDGSYTNLLANPSFESGLANWSSGSGGLTTSYGSAGLPNYHAATFASHGGQVAQTVRGSTIDTLIQIANVEANTTYTLSAWVTGATPTSSINARLRIKDVRGKEFLDAVADHTAVTPPTTDDAHRFRRITLTFTTNADTSQIKVILSDSPAAAGTTIYWDFVELEKDYPDAALPVPRPDW